VYSEAICGCCVVVDDGGVIVVSYGGTNEQSMASFVTRCDYCFQLKIGTSLSKSPFCFLSVVVAQVVRFSRSIVDAPLDGSCLVHHALHRKAEKHAKMTAFLDHFYFQKVAQVRQGDFFF